jgi:ligand-binding sensor domain-containing protein
MGAVADRAPARTFVGSGRYEGDDRARVGARRPSEREIVQNTGNRSPRAAASAAGTLLGAALLAAVLHPAAPAVAQSHLWLPEDRLLVTAFHDVTGLATDLRRVYAVSSEGIQVYDFAARRWDAPVTAVQGFPQRERPTALAFDLVESALLVGTAAGDLLIYRVDMQRWDRRPALASGPILAIAAGTSAREDAIYLATRGGLLRLRRGSFMAEPVRPDEVPPPLRARLHGPGALTAADPALASASGTLGLDARLRRQPITAIVPGEGRGSYWIGTMGGLAAFDSRFMETTWHEYGLVGRGVGAIARAADGFWFGGDGRSPRRGVAWADARLQQWRHHEAPLEGAPTGHVADIAGGAGVAWFAASDGLFRLDRRSGVWRRFTEADGLPALRVLTLAAAGDGVWAGTRRGLVRMGPHGAETPALFRATAVLRVRELGDTLWIATERGLFALGPSRDTILAAGGAADGAGQGPGVGPTLDVAAIPGALVVLTPDALFLRQQAAGGEPVWSGPLREPFQAGLGRGHALAAGDGQLWVAGDAGVARLDLGTGLWTFYTVPGDVPEGPVHGVLPDGEHVWLATPGGALRLRWRR